MSTQQEIRDRLGCKINVGDVVTIQNAHIIWPNFSGAADQYNSAGDRNFNIHLTKEQADELAADGWNVKCKPARDEDEDGEERCVLKITVKYKDRSGELKKNPPKVFMIGSNSRNRTLLSDETIGLIDSSSIVEADLSFVPYFWEINGIGVAAYLRTLYVVTQEDELDMKWAEPADE